MLRWMTVLVGLIAATAAIAGQATVQSLEPLAKGGDVSAQYDLGMLYLNGKSDDDAEQWLLAAAQRRHPLAQLALANLFADRAIATARDGHVGPFDGSNAFYWLVVAEHYVTTDPDRASARKIRDRLIPMLAPDLIAQIENSIKPALKELDDNDAVKKQNDSQRQK